MLVEDKYWSGYKREPFLDLLQNSAEGPIFT